MKACKFFFRKNFKFLVMGIGEKNFFCFQKLTVNLNSRFVEPKTPQNAKPCFVLSNEIVKLEVTLMRENLNRSLY